RERYRKCFESAILARDLIRVHAVSEVDNPLYWKLLHAAGKKGGLPVLYNTSFNLFGEPLVCTPRDAVRSFYSSGIDAMFIGNFFLQKRARRALCLTMFCLRQRLHIRRRPRPARLDRTEPRQSCSTREINRAAAQAAQPAFAPHRSAPCLPASGATVASLRPARIRSESRDSRSGRYLACPCTGYSDGYRTGCGARPHARNGG